ncbi:hypothetical protein BJY00DRAFT_317827 [Aspergillus carlsbadensis]|nr:hypothetical protein BJY00DRAFT_317827 [Aspergillus carlsbadensis]
MALIKQDLRSIAIAAERHIRAYSADLISPSYPTSTARAAKLATYYLAAISLFTGGAPTQLSDPSLFAQFIAGPLERIQGLALDVVGHRVEPVAENSAIIWLMLRVDGRAEVSNVYFFRRGDDGEVGFEGAIFDGELWLLRQLGLA